MAYLWWNLASPLFYQAGRVLECAIAFTAPEAGKYYLLGALYTPTLEYISGSIFGVLLPEGSQEAVGSAWYTSIWELEAEEKKELPCRFVFDRSEAVLGVFLVKMKEDAPSLEYDEQIDSLSAHLSSQAPPLTVGSLISLAMAAGMCGLAMQEILQEE